jgi:outer membrane immunogenic protein
MNRLNRILMGCVAAGALSCSANAADLPVKAQPMPVPIEVYNWTGFYVGGHIGGGWSDDSDDPVNFQRFTGAPPGTPHPLQSGTFGGNNSFAFGGGQIGYNWQAGKFVYGLEADISGAGSRRSASLTLAEGPITDVISNSSGPDWFGTVRGRAGYLFSPRALGYVTGGLAYGHANNDFTQVITGPGPVGTFVLNNGTGTHAGWTVGAGLEYMIAPQWSVKGEYQYIDLDNGTFNTTTIHFNPGRGGNTGVFNTTGADTRVHTLQVGLNYHFGGPVVAKY